MVEKAEHVKSAAVFNNAEGETKAAELLASAFAEAGEVLVELRRIETAEGVATNLSISRNVVYLPQGQQTLLALLVSVTANPIANKKLTKKVYKMIKLRHHGPLDSWADIITQKPTQHS